MHIQGLDWDHKTRTNAIYRIAGKGRKGWSRHVDRELGNYDYLLGIDVSKEKSLPCQYCLIQTINLDRSSSSGRSQ
jgi:hypothetical protein